MDSKKRLLIFSGVLCFLLGLSVDYFSFSYKHFLKTPLLDDSQKSCLVWFPAGMSTREFSKSLAREGIIKHPYLFEIFIRYNRAGQALQAGEYEITPQMVPAAFLNNLIKGDVVKHAIQFIEGWTAKAVLAKLHAEHALKHETLNLSQTELLKALDSPYPSLEGLLFPDTYSFTRNTTDLSILQRAYHEMEKRLHLAWLGRDPHLTYTTPYEALIAASIIEKESGVDSERSLVSGVIQRRLKKGMLLQVDASVIYGLGEHFTGDLKKADLKFETPYNTYLHRGLPPTPIAMPSEASILAALHPAQGKFLYFVSKGDGTHFFSDNLVEHSRAVKEYQIHGKPK